MSSVFDHKGSPPDDQGLDEVLGGAKASRDVLSRQPSTTPGVTLEWKFYEKKHGWQLKANRQRRALIYLIPHAGSFGPLLWHVRRPATKKDRCAATASL